MDGYKAEAARMKTRFELEMELGDAIRKEVKSRFPSIDPDWVVKRLGDLRYENSVKTAQILMAMVPEIIRSQRLTKEVA
jgi:hypothetical protein